MSKSSHYYVRCLSNLVMPLHSSIPNLSVFMVHLTLCSIFYSHILCFYITHWVIADNKSKQIRSKKGPGNVFIPIEGGFVHRFHCTKSHTHICLVMHTNNDFIVWKDFHLKENTGSYLLINNKVANFIEFLKCVQLDLAACS